MSEKEILNIVEGFRSCTLPPSLWTHQAHLITGLWFNFHYPPLEALCYMRSGIICYNVSTGGENTPEKGYHETLTVFWSKVLAQYLANRRTGDFEGICHDFLQSSWSTKELPFSYYRRDTLFSLRARATWVEPDIKGLEETA